MFRMQNVQFITMKFAAPFIRYFDCKCVGDKNAEFLRQDGQLIFLNHDVNGWNCNALVIQSCKSLLTVHV